MSSRIKQIHIDCLAALKAPKSGLLSNPFKYWNIFDDQINEMISGKTYSYNTPSCFIEFQPGEVKNIGANITEYRDSIWRVHLINMVLDGQNNTMEQNLSIFDVRDFVKSVMLNANISFCSKLQQSEDRLDYKHGNIYKYILGFKSNFLDNKGSLFDTDSGFAIADLVNPILTDNITLLK